MTPSKMSYCRIERSEIKRNFNCYSNVAVTDFEHFCAYCGADDFMF